MKTWQRLLIDIVLGGVKSWWDKKKVKESKVLPTEAETVDETPKDVV